MLYFLNISHSFSVRHIAEDSSVDIIKRKFVGFIMKKHKLFCALMGTFLLFLLFDVYEKNKKTAMETFNVNAITEEEITDELIIALFIEDITKEINAFYSEHYSGEIEVYNYEVSVLDVSK